VCQHATAFITAHHDLLVAERVFSLLNASFGASQANTLKNYLEATILLWYNKWWFYFLVANYNKHFCGAYYGWVLGIGT